MSEPLNYAPPPRKTKLWVVIALILALCLMLPAFCCFGVFWSKSSTPVPAPMPTPAPAPVAP